MSRSIFLSSDPVSILEDLMCELRWKQRLLNVGVEEPMALINIPKNPHYLMAQTIEIRLRWMRPVLGGVRREGANMPRFSDTEVHLLSRLAIRERMEAWFTEVLARIGN